MLALIVFISLASFCMSETSPDQDLINKILKFSTECAVKKNIKFDLCLDMFKDGIDLTDKKYDDCKCMVPCVSKKMNAMSEDEKFDFPAIEGYIENLKTPGWKEEGKRVYPLCKDQAIGANGCEAGFHMVECVMKNSEKAKALTMKLVKILSGSASA